MHASIIYVIKDLVGGFFFLFYMGQGVGRGAKILKLPIHKPYREGSGESHVFGQDSEQVSRQ